MEEKKIEEVELEEDEEELELELELEDSAADSSSTSSEDWGEKGTDGGEESSEMVGNVDKSGKAEKVDEEEGAMFALQLELENQNKRSLRSGIRCC